MDAPAPAALATWRAFLEAHARVTEALERELLEDCNLPLSWYDVLVQLSEGPDEGLRMHELASAVLLSRAGLTRLVDRMTAAGLVERRPCPDDRRGTLVAMTAEGKRRLREAAPGHLAGIERHFTSRLSEAELAAMAEALSRVTAPFLPELAVRGATRPKPSHAGD